MATLAEPLPGYGSDDRFFLKMAVAMMALVFTAFSLHLAMGRSTFASPLIVHAHAVAFMGWIVLFVLQNIFVTRGSMALHRTLGWIGVFWIVAMIALGMIVTVLMVQRGGVPFFFAPLNFLIFDTLTVLAFAGLAWAAVAMRRRTDWHRRLHYCGTAMLMGPAISRLIPSPMFMPWSYEAGFIPVLIFPAIGMVGDLRRNRPIHPAWWWGFGVMAGSIVLTELLTYSAIGEALYRMVTEGTPGASLPPLALGAPPPGA